MSNLKKTSYLNNAVRRYKSLFSFPKYWTLIILISFISIFGSIIAFAITFTIIEGIYRGLIFSIQVLIIPVLITDIISTNFITKKDAIFNLKRNASLSLSTCIISILTLNIGSLIQRIFSITTALNYASLFNICIVISIRFLVLFSVSQLKFWEIVASTIFQPSLQYFLIIIFWNLINPITLVTVILASTILLLATYFFIFLVNKRGELTVGIGAISLFRGFLANWLEGLTYPLEGYFEQMGSNSDVYIKTLFFRNNTSLIALMVIPEIHPGPFRNLGSSNIPYMIQKTLEKKFNVITMVPHGTSGHELDLTSQFQCEKVLKDISLIGSSIFDTFATKLIRTEIGLGKATCQLFGNVALVTVTCAPLNMEDVPREIGSKIISKGIELGANAVIVIDAHNSIRGSDEVPILSDTELQDLVLSANKALELALKEPKDSYKIGIAKIFPELKPTDGMGPGGITALIVIVGEQKIAYVTIDGNNMVSGLREKIHLSLKDLVNDCEILTSDTHIVNALTSTERGYYPIGEVIDQNDLILYIRNVVIKALANTYKSQSSYNFRKVHNVKIIGEEKLITLSKLVDSTFNFMIRVAPIIFIPALMISFLTFFILSPI